MILPGWPNIDFKIKKLNVSGWFKGWFSKTEVNIVISSTVNIPPANPSPSTAPQEDALLQKPSDKSSAIILSSAQLKILAGVDRVHRINGNNSYSFEDDLKWGLYYLQNKPAKDWPVNAAARFSQAMQDIIFFDAFVVPNDREKRTQFDEIKKRLNYILNRHLHELRHTNKRGQIEGQFKSPYHVQLDRQPEIRDNDYEMVFDDFQNLLAELFDNFNLKERS